MAAAKAAPVEGVSYQLKKEPVDGDLHREEEVADDERHGEAKKVRETFTPRRSRFRELKLHHSFDTRATVVVREARGECIVRPSFVAPIFRIGRATASPAPPLPPPAGGTSSSTSSRRGERGRGEGQTATEESPHPQPLSPGRDDSARPTDLAGRGRGERTAAMKPRRPADLAGRGRGAQIAACSRRGSGYTISNPASTCQPRGRRHERA